MKSLSLILKMLAALVVIYFSFLMLQITLPYTSFRKDIDFLLTKTEVIHLNYWLNAFYIHIFSSVFVLLAGATQFWRKLMFVYPKWHRNIGKMYVGIILFISGPGALVMSLHANGNWISKLGFTVLTILWWTFTYRAYTSVRKKDFITHSNFMMRSYALTFSAVTLRLYQALLNITSLYTIFPHEQAYILFAWLSWIPNLLLVEFLIKRGASKWFMQKV